MTTNTGSPESQILSPDEAFSVLGNETRMDILHQLGKSKGPVSFTDLRDDVGLRQGGQFNYHLDKLTDHFVAKTDAGYELTQRGRRVVEAILSGAVTEDPVLERERIRQACYHCGAPVEIDYQHERVGVYCSECDGNYGRPESRSDIATGDGSGLLGYLRLPPAGVQGRSPDEILAAAFTWGDLQFMARGSGVCPRCSAPLEESVEICSDHEVDGGICKTCDNRYAIQHHAQCPNCIYDSTGLFMLSLLANTELLDFFTSHGLNPVSASSELDVYAVTGDYDEELLSLDPFEACITFTIGDDAITLTVGDDLSVVETERHCVFDPE